MGYNPQNPCPKCGCIVSNDVSKTYLWICDICYNVYDNKSHKWLHRSTNETDELDTLNLDKVKFDPKKYLEEKEIPVEMWDELYEHKKEFENYLLRFKNMFESQIKKEINHSNLDAFNLGVASVWDYFQDYLVKQHKKKEQWFYKMLDAFDDSSYALCTDNERAFLDELKSKSRFIDISLGCLQYSGKDGTTEIYQYDFNTNLKELVNE